MTKAPELVTNQNLLKLNFDGLFNQLESNQVKFSDHQYFPDISSSHKD
jgi:hypothetical protein